LLSVIDVNLQTDRSLRFMTGIQWVRLLRRVGERWLQRS